MQALKRSILAIVTILVSVGALAFLVPAFAEAAPAWTTQPGVATSTLHANVRARAEWAHARHAERAARVRLSALIKGNGEPIVGGTVSAVSGSTLTVTTKSSIAYTVDAASATVIKDHATSTLASVAQGDAVVVQGTVNGTAITASSIIDQAATPAGTSRNSVTGAAHRFFGAVGGFFTRLFGFF